MMAARAQQIDAEPGREAGAELLQSVQDIFGASCKAAWLSGSFAYEGARAHRSDVDIVIVLQDSTALPADAGTLHLIRRFVDAYLEIHARHGFDPDVDFPGEFVTPAMLEQAIDWRGLAWEGRAAEAFPPVDSDDYWLGRPDRWYNAWLSMTAFSRFPVGDRVYHSAMKLEAWKTVTRFLLLRTARRRLSPDEMLLGLDQFGVKPRYPDFWPVERDWVDRALDELQDEGALSLADGMIERDMDRLGEWERHLNEAIGRGAEPLLLLDTRLHRDIEAYAASRWADLAAAIA
jgi:hypothetical protein